MSEKHCDCGCIYLEAECPNCNRQSPQDSIKELEAKLADAAAALKEIFDGKNWRLGQKFDPNSGNFDLSTQRKAYIKIKGEQP